MKLFYLIVLPLILTGCFDDTAPVHKEEARECFMIQTSASLMPIMLDKCTGNSWQLVKTAMIDQYGKVNGLFTFRWNSLAVVNEEAEIRFNE